MAPKRGGAKAEAKAEPKRGAAKARAEPPAEPKRGAAKAKPEPKPEPKRGAAKAKAEPEPKRGAPKAKAAPEPEPKRGAAKAKAKAEAAAPAGIDLDGMSTAELKSKLKELGGSTSGTKQDLIDRIKALSEAAGSAPKRAAPEAAEAPAPKRGKAAAPEPPATRGAAKKAPTLDEQHEFLDAAKEGEFDRVKELLEAKPELLDVQPADRWTALHQASYLGNKDAVAYLLEKGASLTATTEDGKTPEEVADNAGVRGLFKKKEAPKRAASEPASPAPKRGGAAKAKASPAKRQKAADDGPSSSQPAGEAAEASVVFFEDGEYKAEYAKSGKSKCKRCQEAIAEGGLRLGKMVQSDKFDGKYPVWMHAACFLGAGCLPRFTGQIAGFSALKPEDQELILAKVPAVAGGIVGEGGVSPEIQEQNKKVFGVIETLKTMSDNQLKDMLEVNEYPSKHFPQGTVSLHELCADGVLFGALLPCKVCSTEQKQGRLLLSTEGGESYKCKGWINEFLRCTHRMQTPERTPWVLTEAAKMAGGGALKKMKLKTGTRLFAHPIMEGSGDAAASGPRPALLGLQVVFTEDASADDMSKEQLVAYVKEHGGAIAEKVTKAVNCVISTEAASEANEDEIVKQAKEFKVPGVSADFLTASVKDGDLVDMTPHLLWGEARERRRQEETKMRFLEKDGVIVDADIGTLVEKAHVMVERSERRVWSEMFSRTDMATGANSFYILHLLEADDDSSPEYWIFRKWGRIGVNQGGTKVESFGSSKISAINNFKKQYLEKTGNAFGHAKDDFVVKPGLFVRVDMEHKALGDPSKIVKGQVKEMGGDQPLGKLTKTQVEKGEKVLDKIDALLQAGEDASSPQLMAFSAEYYTLIPHNFGTKKPPSINNAELFGTEKALVQFYLRMGFEDMGGEEEQKLPVIDGVMKQAVPKTLSDAAKMVCKPSDIKSCDTKAKGLHKKKAGSPEKDMGPELYGAILLYTANAIYKDLNKVLRDEDRAKVLKYYPYLRLLFEACARLPKHKKTLWRGIGVDLFPQYKVGGTIIWWGVSSCTSDESVARNFMAGCGDGATLLTVETETATDIAELSFFANEAESILLPGTKLEVVSATRKGGKSEISLREVGRVVS